MSPPIEALAYEHDAAAEQGTRDVVDLATRRRRGPVRASRLPDRTPRPLLDAAAAGSKAAHLLLLAHETDPAFADAREDAVREALAGFRDAIAILGALPPGGAW